MKTIISSHSERLALIKQVEEMHRKYERISFKMSLIERKMLEHMLAKNKEKMTICRDKLLDIMSFSFIPAFKYYAEAFFTIYSSSSADMDYFFDSKLTGFLNVIISTISLANDKHIHPNRESTTGISRKDVDELFRIAYRQVGYFQLFKRWRLYQIKKLFEPLIKKYPAILSEDPPEPTKKEALKLALINKINSMNEESLKTAINLLAPNQQN